MSMMVVEMDKTTPLSVLSPLVLLLTSQQQLGQRYHHQLVGPFENCKRSGIEELLVF